MSVSHNLNGWRCEIFNSYTCVTMKEQEQRSGQVKGTNKGTAEEQQRINKGTIMNNQKQPEKNRNSQEQRRNKGKQRWSCLEWVWNSSDEHQYGTEALEGTWLFLKDIWLPSAAPWKTVGDKNTQPPPQPLIHRTNPPNI